MIAVVPAVEAMSPPQIDKQLAALDQRMGKALARKWHAEDSLSRERKRSGHYVPSSVSYFHEAIEKAEAEIDAITLEMAPYQEEFIRRGGWTRAFLVTNVGGHVHRSMNCSTCYPRTRYAWMTDWSGADEARIVADAASRACTVCYPSAPVDKPSVMFTAEEREAAALREAERVKREVKKAEKAAKAITAPDGSPLRGRWGVIATERTAQIEAVDALLDHRVWGEFQASRWEIHGNHVSEAEWQVRCADNAARYAAQAVPLIEALAAKRGQSAEQVRAELQKKADAKYRKDYS